MPCWQQDVARLAPAARAARLAGGACLLVAVTVAPVGAQRLSVGGKGGVPLTGTLKAASPEFISSTGRYIAGPAVELRLFHRFALEVDAL